MPETPISEIDRMAYIDGQLDDQRRLDVEGALSRDPPAAAQVMSDLARRTALRIGLRSLGGAPSVALRARLDDAVVPSRHPARRMLAAGVVGALVLGVAVAGAARWITNAGPSSVADDAIQSRQATLLRTRMDSQVETPRLAIREIRTAVRVRLPTLPAGWTLLDVQVFPSDAGPAVQLMIDAGDQGRVFLFASRDVGDSGPDAPVLIRRQGETVAVWEVEGHAFALIGDTPRQTLRAMAIDLADNRFL